MTPTPLQSAEWRLTAAAGTADERDKCVVRAPDIRAVLNELARLQELELRLELDMDASSIGAGEVREHRIHPTVGSCVTFVDGFGVPHAALVTAVWGAPSDICQPALNLCYVSLDPNALDQMHSHEVLYEASIVHRTMQSAPGNYWRWEDEE